MQANLVLEGFDPIHLVDGQEDGTLAEPNCESFQLPRSMYPPPFCPLCAVGLNEGSCDCANLTYWLYACCVFGPHTPSTPFLSAP